ncbi:DMT family transporter [Hyphomicrobium sp. MC8b]|uniref:DMT family transporter n=1 Tax=Hyphomicrobium sp. MC8b TaxID=300273 RepID=UPI00391A9697
MSTLQTYAVLLLAVAIEVVATSALKASNSMTRLLPSVISLFGYAIAFYLLSVTMRTVPVGIAYALWAGIGVVLISAIGWLWFGQRLDFPAMIGIALIAAGVITVNVFSNSTGQ